mmetsp:Transcript_75956/g.180631  ORF Transcript_75956/g.180631 Transcript_75956/m.180631 type:complete len:368 (+) Transcript_75956:90-1193(+)
MQPLRSRAALLAFRSVPCRDAVVISIARQVPSSGARSLQPRLQTDPVLCHFRSSPFLVQTAIPSRWLATSSDQRSEDSTEEPEGNGSDSSKDSAASSEGASPQGASKVVLWEAEPLTKQFSHAEQRLYMCIGGYGLSVGVAMLGVAGFMEPSMFAIGIVLAVLQGRLGYSFAARPLIAQAQRHVEKMELKVDGSKKELVAKCGGGLTRTLELTESSSDDKPSLGEVFREAEVFILLDESRKLGGDDAARHHLMDESGLVIKTETLLVEPTLEEDTEAIKKLVQKLLDLNRTELAKLQTKVTRPIKTSEEEIAAFISRLQTLVSLSAALGLAIFVGASSKANEPVPGVVPLIARQDSLRYPSFRGPVG